MREMVIHLNLFAIALAGAIAGFFASRFGGLWTPDQIWTAATIPVAVALAVSMLRDMLAGRFGVDAIALVAMLASIAMGEPLAGVVVAMMYSGGNLLAGGADDAPGRDHDRQSFGPWRQGRAHRGVDDRHGDLTR